jgi:hypothetical protein
MNAPWASADREADSVKDPFLAMARTATTPIRIRRAEVDVPYRMATPKEITTTMCDGAYDMVRIRPGNDAAGR